MHGELACANTFDTVQLLWVMNHAIAMHKIQVASTVVLYDCVCDPIEAQYTYAENESSVRDIRLLREASSILLPVRVAYNQNDAGG